MDAEKRARRQSLRVLISESIMVIAVIATVSVLAFVVSGYWVGSGFTIERQGLAQIYSSPTGADVEIDGETSSWLQRTNTSKTLSAGEHTITLSKEGYDTWSRTITINEGLLYRLHYPRLFLKNRTEESALASSANFAAISPDRNTILLINNTTTWQTFNLDSDSATPQPLKLAEILPFSSVATGASGGLFSGEIKDAKWASDNEHVLLKIEDNGAVNWLVLNIKNPSSSVNITKAFNADFSEVEILDSSANNLLVVLNQNLHRIDVGAKQISAILVEKILSFDYHNQNLVFIAEKVTADSEEPYYVGLNQLGSSEIKTLAALSNSAKIITMKFYDDEYIGILDGASFSLYLKRDFGKKAEFSLTFAPEELKVGENGEFVIMNAGGHIATLDMEAMDVSEWSIEADNFDWLDGSMLYAVKDGILNVYDFNGLNHRTLSSNVSAHFPVTITSDKYLYYFRDGTLIREWLIER